MTALIKNHFFSLYVYLWNDFCYVLSLYVEKCIIVNQLNRVFLKLCLWTYVHCLVQVRSLDNKCYFNLLSQFSLPSHNNLLKNYINIFFSDMSETQLLINRISFTQFSFRILAFLLASMYQFPFSPGCFVKHRYQLDKPDVQK